MVKISSLELNSMFLQMRKRAERYSDKQLVDTFVNAGFLLQTLSNEDHQILYGRRGTGKTHALKYLSDKVTNAGDISIYIDILRLGSDNSIYNDPNLPVTERAVRLLRDVLNEIHDSLLSELIDLPTVDLQRLSNLIDAFGQAMPKVEVQGSVEQEATENRETGKKFTLSSTLSRASTSAGLAYEKSGKDTITERHKETGERRYTVRFVDVGKCISSIALLVPGRRIWILIDEWSSLSKDVQPFLADMLRKSFFNISSITVKIAAIEHRSKFYLEEKEAQYIGFELGADIGSNLNLDDYLVFDNDQKRSTKFFADLFYRHIASIAAEKGIPSPATADELVRNGFSQDRAFDELVRASEGVPRDAIHILSSAAQKASDGQISIPNIRQAARTFFQTDKSDVVTSNSVLSKLLSYIINEVISDRKTSIFLLESGQANEDISKLFDRRVLHIKSNNISSRDHRGKRFLAYKIDYGCYIDLVYTKRFPMDVALQSDGFLDGAPDMMLEDDTLTGEMGTDSKTGTIEVPQDDKRSYRRAILDLSKFRTSLSSPHSRSLSSSKIVGSKDETPDQFKLI